MANGFTYFRKGDVLLAKITPCFENGKGACLDELPTPFGFGSTEFHVLRAKHEILPQYLYRLTTHREFRQLAQTALRIVAVRIRQSDRLFGASESAAAFVGCTLGFARFAPAMLQLGVGVLALGAD